MPRETPVQALPRRLLVEPMVGGLRASFEEATFGGSRARAAGSQAAMTPSVYSA